MKSQILLHYEKVLSVLQQLQLLCFANFQCDNAFPQIIICLGELMIISTVIMYFINLYIPVTLINIHCLPLCYV